MSAIDDAIQANEEYYRTFTSGQLAVQPAKKLAVVTCMDSRMDLFALLGLKHGDAHMIRNAGGIVTDDVIRSLIISHHLLGTQEVMVINHTDCGLNMIQDDEFRRRMQRTSGTAAIAPAAFHAFSDIEDNVREQVQKVDTHPWLSKEMEVRGFVYDVRTGRLTEVSQR
jgi:carbonic anhydrase